MKIWSAFLLLITSLLFLNQIVKAQGCSDAGFCTIDSFKPNSNDSTETLKNQFKVGAFYGNADHSILAYGSYLEYNRQLNDKWGVDVKLTSIGQTGNDISVFGLSDVFANVNYKATDKLKLTVGTKLPLSAANNTLDGLPLPMDYQPSLGTVDLLLGVGYSIKGLQLVAALQQPLTQNDNQFLASAYPPDAKLSSIRSTNEFKRAGDVLLRISYPFQVFEKLKFTPSLLPIYHLANDKYTDEFNVEREIENSEGLTLNSTFYLDYSLSEKSAIQVNAGMPFIVREARPDGLTRSFILNLEYKFRF